MTLSALLSERGRETGRKRNSNVRQKHWLPTACAWTEEDWMCQDGG